jgi:hypothetical protein
LRGAALRIALERRGRQWLCGNCGRAEDDGGRGQKASRERFHDVPLISIDHENPFDHRGAVRA